MSSDAITFLDLPISRKKRRKSVLTVFGTRPEVIKLAPVLALGRRREFICTVNVSSGQHSELLHPFVDLFGVRVHYDLGLMTCGQSVGGLLRRVVSEVSDVIAQEEPDLVLVQGDTTTALGGAIAGCNCGVPVAHVEAGLRSGNLRSPYPEEMHRVAITQLASVHFAATERNRQTLLQEGISREATFVTGNPIVDTLELVRRCGDSNSGLLKAIGDRKCVVLTTHRRESFGAILEENLRIVRAFVEEHEDVALVFPVHPNPSVRIPAYRILEGHPRIILIQPLPYFDFIHLISRCWLVVSDSGGIQEEVPSLGKPLLILRENTERPECIEAGMARLVGARAETLQAMLEEAYQPTSWVNSVHKVANPFGHGDSGERIANHVVCLLQGRPARHVAASQFVPAGYRARSNAPAQIL